MRVILLAFALAGAANGQPSPPSNPQLLKPVLSAPPPVRVLDPAAPIPGPGLPVPARPLAAPVKREAQVNFQVQVQWKKTEGTSHQIQLVTTEGTFMLEAIVPEKDNNKSTDLGMPATVSLQGNIEILSSDKGLVKLSLSRTVPFVSGRLPGGGGFSPAIQQAKVSLSSNVAVTFGKPVTIQKDDAEEVILLVTRLED